MLSPEFLVSEIFPVDEIDIIMGIVGNIRILLLPDCCANREVFLDDITILINNNTEDIVVTVPAVIVGYQILPSH
jgi:hypothetical protein